MITLNKLRTIAKAKFSDKSNLGDWYKGRLEICSQCPYNSKNKQNLTIKEKAVVTMNFGKDSCLACTCEIDAKASVREENCGLIKIGQQPLWEALPTIEKADYSDLQIENLSADKATMIIGKQVIFDYGTILRNSNSSIDISIKDKDNKIKSVNTRSGCGCTVATPKKVGDTFYVTITYDTKRIGNFNKQITFIVSKEDSTQQFITEIKGTVK